jgi:uncharacterized protein YbjT (DUF2867 family)
MRVVVIGGTGLIGSKLVVALVDHGHEVVAASPRSGVNTLTGEGLAEAVKGAVALSFVGTERLSEGGDFRGKIAQAKSGASLGVIRLEDWLGLRPVSS